MGEPVISLRKIGLVYKTRTGLFSSDRFRALEGIDLDLRRGETLGVIGANGSGKSTLLRVIAGIYTPDEGDLEYHGISRVSLLSLGLGFTPELSGRDNAIFGAMLLGASLREARGKVDEIIEFAELEEFARRPMQTYSTGMRSRLGFSVALTMEADVLLIDETLAVGDAHFKKKSEAALRERITSQQTVVLVSHSLGQLEDLCDRVAWIDHGRLAALGDPAETLAAYTAST
jgi:lipopolysaccharide transport system ATP-binding protein